IHAVIPLQLLKQLRMTLLQLMRLLKKTFGSNSKKLGRRTGTIKVEHLVLLMQPGGSRITGHRTQTLELCCKHFRPAFVGIGIVQPRCPIGTPKLVIKLMGKFVENNIKTISWISG